LPGFSQAKPQGKGEEAMVGPVEVYLERAGEGICSPFFDQDGYLHFVAERTGDIYSVDKNKFVVW